MNKIISISLLILALGVGYYFFWYLPQENQAQQDIANKERCAEVGQKLSDEDKQQYNTTTWGSNTWGSTSQALGFPYDWSKYAYNSQLNTCLYANAAYIFSSDGSGSLWTASIEDSLTTKTLVYVRIKFDSKGNYKTDTDKTNFDNFFKQEDELMGTHDSDKLSN